MVRADGDHGAHPNGRSRDHDVCGDDLYRDREKNRHQGAVVDQAVAQPVSSRWGREACEADPAVLACGRIDCGLVLSCSVGAGDGMERRLVRECLPCDFGVQQRWVLDLVGQFVRICGESGREYRDHVPVHRRWYRVHGHFRFVENA